MGALIRAFFFLVFVGDLLGAGVFGHSLCSLRDGVFGQLSWEEETDSCLDLSAGDGGSTVVVSKAGCLSSNTLEDVIHEGVHDGHGFAGDSSIGMDLLQNLIDVDSIGFPPPPLAFLISSTHSFCFAGSLLGAF